MTDSHEELDRQLAPVYNFATYQIFSLAEMTCEPTVLGSDVGWPLPGISGR